MKYKKLQSGYALLTSIILTATLVLVAYAVANIALRQLTLTVTSTESHGAFYVADSGLECAIFWDLKNPNNPSVSAFGVGSSGSVTCGNSSVTPSRVVSGGVITSTFQIPVSSSCAIIRVVKNLDNTTTIESRGYNTCGTGLRFERAVRITY